jgi:hypothetical protein
MAHPRDFITQATLSLLRPVDGKRIHLEVIDLIVRIDAIVIVAPGTEQFTAKKGSGNMVVLSSF